MAITNVYVDPAINANSGTGTIGDPYGDLQYALNTKARDATNGDQFNIKAGTAEVLTAALSLATYGTPSATAPLVFRGYTSAANDGGIGTITGNGSYGVMAGAANDYQFWIDLHLTNFGANAALALRYGCEVLNCEIDTGSGGGIAGTSIYVSDCYLHDLTGNHGIQGAVYTVRNRLVNCGGPSSYAIALGLAGSVCFDNLIVLPSAGSAVNGIYVTGSGCQVRHNSVFAVGKNGSGIYAGPAENVSLVNNIIEGFSGGGLGLVHWSSTVAAYYGNAFYNNSTHVYGPAAWIGLEGNNDTLSESPFMDAANGDFRVKPWVTNAAQDAWPTQIPGLSTTPLRADKGAAQLGAWFRRAVRQWGG